VVTLMQEDEEAVASATGSAEHGEVDLLRVGAALASQTMHSALRTLLELS